MQCRRCKFLSEFLKDGFCDRCESDMNKIQYDKSHTDQELFNQVAIAAMQGMFAGRGTYVSEEIQKEFIEKSFGIAQAFMSERSKYLKK